MYLYIWKKQKTFGSLVCFLPLLVLIGPPLMAKTSFNVQPSAMLQTQRILNAAQNMNAILIQCMMYVQETSFTLSVRCFNCLQYFKG